MRVFITGGTGFIGSAVVNELVSAGHEVIGLARSVSSAQALERAGATAVSGSIDDIEAIKHASDSADAVIHTAYVHDFSDIAAAAKMDSDAIKAIGETLAGSNRPFIVTSGIPVDMNGKTITEDYDIDTTVMPRFTESAALPFAARGVRVCAVRPSRFVHGEGDKHAFTPRFIEIARKNGMAAYVGSGDNRFQAVHRLDVAHLYCLALEKGAAGAKYNAVADTGITFRAMAEAIGKGLNVPAVSVSAEIAKEQFGFLASFLGVDNPASSEKTRKALGWQPVHPTLLQDLAAGFYFKL